MRLFAALQADAELKSEIRRIQSLIGPFLGDAVRWTRAEQAHLTLRFFGEVEDSYRFQLEEHLTHAASEHSPFSAEIRTCGVFPERGAARVVWIDLADRSGELERLAKDIESAARGLGFPPENRPFRPHLTIARLSPPLDRKQCAAMLTAVDIRPLCREFSSFELVQSHLSSTGARHEPLRSFKLGRSRT